MPDPERWLKKRERTKVEGRGGRRKKEGMGAGATQGVTVSDAQPPVSSKPVAKKGKKGR